MNDKMKKTIGLLITIIIAGAGIWYYIQPSLTFTEIDPVLEKGDEYAAIDFVGKSKGNVSADSEYLDTAKTGDYELKYTVTNFTLSKEYVLNYSVIDTTPPTLRVVEDVVTIDPHEEYNRRDVLYNIIVDEGTLSYETDLDVSMSGTYDVKVRAIDDAGNASEISYEVTVRDIEAPFVFNDGDGIRILKGSDFDIRDYVVYGDNADPHPELEVEGEVDTGKVGRYTLRLKLSDHSGNETKWNATVTVVSKFDPEDDYYDDEKDLFEDFKKKYQGEGRMLGIDVSEWQGDIDFEAVKKAGCEFVILRIGFSRQGHLVLDQAFRDNLQGVQEAGLPFGIYYYSNDRSKEDVLQVLDEVFAELDGVKPDLPIAFDWENFTDFQEYEVSFQDINQFYDVFEQKVKEMGCKSILYSSKYYLENIWMYTDKRPIWLAHYTDWSSYEGPYQIWQVSAWGRIDGIEEDVDLNILFTEPPNN